MPSAESPASNHQRAFRSRAKPVRSRPTKTLAIVLLFGILLSSVGTISRLAAAWEARPETAVDVGKFSPLDAATLGGVAWARQFGTAVADFPQGAAAEPSGGYVVGYTYGALPGQTFLGSTDAFVRKYAPNGTELWTRQFGSALYDFALGSGADASGVYVAGYTNGALPGQTSAGFADVFVRKYDPNGTELWTQQFGTATDDIGFGAAADASGVYVVGYTPGALPGQTNAGSYDTFVRKYDPNGTELWTRQFGSAANDFALGTAADDVGAFVVGYTNGALPGQTFIGAYDAFVRKYDANGTELWTQQFGSTTDDYAIRAGADATGGYVVGHTNGALPGQTSAGGTDAFIRKYGSNGTELWTRQFGSAVGDYVQGAAADTSGIYLAGYTYGAFGGYTNAGSADVFVQRYRIDGSDLGTFQFGSATGDVALGAAADGPDVYVVGYTDGALPGQTSLGGSDGFIVKFPSPPLGVRGLSAAAGDARIDLSWEVPSWDGGSPITGYQIYRGTRPGALSLLVGTIPSLTYTDTNVTNGQPYYYSVTTLNPVGESSFSDEASALPQGPPSAPQAVTAVRGDAQVALTWAAPVTDGGSPITGFRIYRGTAPGSATFLLQVGTVLAHADTGLTNGQSYYYRVAAVNNFGEGPPSIEVSATAATLPTAPQNLRTSTAAGRINLTWDPPASDGGTPIEGYRIYRGTVPGALTSLAEVGVVTTFSDEGAAAGTTYSYQIRAVTAVGTGPPSTEVSGRWAPPGPPTLTLAGPANDSTTDVPTVTVSGTTDPGVRLVVNGIVVAVAADGSFSVSVALNEGRNEITAIATDAAGYVTTRSVTVTYVNPARAQERQLQGLGLILLAAFAAVTAFLFLLYWRLRALAPRIDERPTKPGPGSEPPPV